MKVCSKCGWSTDNDEIRFCQGCGEELVVEKNTVSNSSDEKSHAVQLEDLEMDHLDKYDVLTLILTRDEIRKESVKELIGMYLKVRQHLDDSMNFDQATDNSEIQYALGLCHEYGWCGIEKDEKEAFYHYRNAVEQGNALAMNKLGDCYLKGIGADKNDSMAAQWYRKASESNDAKVKGVAFYKLGLHMQPKVQLKDFALLCVPTLGSIFAGAKAMKIMKDAKESFFYFKMSAELGNDLGMCELGKCYKIGFGCSKDKGEAVFWFKKASELGNEEAKEALKDL